MRKAIRFTAHEKIEKSKVVVEQGIYNGFGRMYELPSKIEIKSSTENFDAFELGGMFIQLGETLKAESFKITNLNIKSWFEESNIQMGKRFMVELSYDTVEETL